MTRLAIIVLTISFLVAHSSAEDADIPEVTLSLKDETSHDENYRSQDILRMLILNDLQNIMIRRSLGEDLSGKGAKVVMRKRPHMWFHKNHKNSIPIQTRIAFGRPLERTSAVDSSNLLRYGRK